MTTTRSLGLTRALSLALVLAPGPLAAQTPLEIQILTRVGAPGQPEGIAVAPDGTVYVGTSKVVGSSTSEPSKVFAYTSTGQLADEWVVQGQVTSSGYGLTGIALDADGLVYVLDRSPPRVLRIDPQTGEQTTYATLHQVLPCSQGGPPGDCSADSTDQVSLPNYPVFAADGTLYITDSQQALIWRVPRGGGGGEVWFTDAILAGIFGPNGIQFRADGETLLLALTGSQQPGPGASAGALYELPVLPDGSPGALSLFWQSLPVDGPDGLSIAASGNVYVALAGANQLVQIGPDGSEIARVPATPIANQQLEIPMDNPASTGFLGERLLMTNQSLFVGNPDSWAVYDIHAGEPGLPLFYPQIVPPVPALSPAALGVLAMLLALWGVVRPARRATM